MLRVKYCKIEVSVSIFFLFSLPPNASCIRSNLVVRGTTAQPFTRSTGKCKFCTLYSTVYPVSEID